MEYGGIKVIKSILPVDFNDVMSFFIQKKGATKMMFSIFDVSPANVFDEMMWDETYFGVPLLFSKKEDCFIWYNYNNDFCVKK